MLALKYAPILTQDSQITQVFCFPQVPLMIVWILGCLGSLNLQMLCSIITTSISLLSCDTTSICLFPLLFFRCFLIILVADWTTLFRPFWNASNRNSVSVKRILHFQLFNLVFFDSECLVNCGNMFKGNML